MVLHGLNDINALNVWHGLKLFGNGIHGFEGLNGKALVAMINSYACGEHGIPHVV